MVSIFPPCKSTTLYPRVNLISQEKLIMNNVNNPTGVGAAGFSNTTTPEAPRNAPEGTCFGGRKVVISDDNSTFSTGNRFNSVATVYCPGADGKLEIKVTIQARDQITSAKFLGDGTKLELTIRNGDVLTFNEDADGDWIRA